MALVREVFAPTPVIFVLNKADVASTEQLKAITETIHRCSFPNNSGIFCTISDRKNYAQSWCTKCFGGEVIFRKSSNQLLCESCGHTETLTPRFGLGSLIDTTAEQLPDLAKEAFLSAQEASLIQKDNYARQIVKQYSKEISIDVAGKALNDIGTMIGRIFVLWVLCT